ncbi:uncharacterized protein T551_00190 [Pneumocystis jirovecii RU7]|uniref:Uncharacterized protein n=1 Tax=Pneumocystis jirovecii (strain RU7) TaxID=1408657 RepID=A0A0W4ZWG6_PNEJ7|nr:uncharacterized protein T551_00190 [Pneumocystis jirovecii RU7]KTW32705.1 hypothetical protein T551_00190 [Pneumocystis jirovecii RU7]
MDPKNTINSNLGKKHIYKEVFALTFRNLGIKKKAKLRNISSKQQKRKKYAMKKAMVFENQLQHKVYKSEQKYFLKKERKNIWDKINENLVK